MRLIVAIFVLLVLGGCSIPRSSLPEFYALERSVAQSCDTLIPADQADALKVNPNTNRSPVTDAAICYKNKMWHQLYATRSVHTDLVDSFAGKLVELAAARDAGKLDFNTYMSERSEAIRRMQTMLVRADQDVNDAARRETADRLAKFAERIGELSAQDAAQRQANRPIVCNTTGIYRTTGVVCH